MVLSGFLEVPFSVLYSQEPPAFMMYCLQGIRDRQTERKQEKTVGLGFALLELSCKLHQMEWNVLSLKSFNSYSLTMPVNFVAIVTDPDLEEPTFQEETWEPLSQREVG